MLSAWGSALLAERHSILNPLGPGWYLDRPHFDDILLKNTLLNSTGPALRASVVGAARQHDRWTLTLNEAPNSLEADIVIDATGRASALSRRIGIPRLSIDQQVCVSARYPASDLSGSEALVESAPGGWWFSAPAAAGEVAVAYFTDSDLLPRDFRNPAAWTRLLQGAPHTYARVNSTDGAALHICSASSSYLRECAGEGWFAVGDAAIAYDPLASQGILKALESSRFAFDSILEGVNETYAMQAYRASQMEAVDRYLAERRKFYNMERRWPNSPYWQRRNDAGQRMTIQHQ
jgi:flavin-dependent dehydrogenase